MTKDSNPLFLFTLIAVFEGLITGINITGISGAISLIQENWEISNLLLGLLVGMLILGCCLGSYLGLSRIGKRNKKTTLLLAAVLLVISPLGCIFSPTIIPLLLFRFAGGIGLGLIWVITPIYISNLFPDRIKSHLLSYSYLAIAIGMLMAYIANYLLLSHTYNWRLMLGFPLLFSIVYCILVMLIPGYHPVMLIQQQTNRTLTNVITGLQQLSGISIIFNYTSSVFETTGLERDLAFGQSIFVGIINLLLTMSIIWFIKNANAYRWHVWGSLGMTISLLYLVYTFAVPSANGIGFMIATFCYIGSFNFLPKLAVKLPNNTNASYKKIPDITILLIVCFSTFMSVLLFPWLLNSLGGAVAFGVLFGLSLFRLLYILLCIPEVKTELHHSQAQNLNMKQ